MNANDRAFVAGFKAALATARACTDRIEASNMHPVRRELAAEALRGFVEEAERALELPAVTVAGKDRKAR